MNKENKELKNLLNLIMAILLDEAIKDEDKIISIKDVLNVEY